MHTLGNVFNPAQIWKRSAEFNSGDVAKLRRNSEKANDRGVKSIVDDLRKRNKYKWFGYHLSCYLYYQNPESILRKSYQNTMYCAGTLEQSDGKLHTHWCKNRWCPACNRNYMGKMINAYRPRLDKEHDLYFLTLTAPNVPACALEDELDKYREAWKYIQNRYWFKKGIKAGIIGIRKVECTYNPVKDTYHPHLHILISNKEFAENIYNAWHEWNLKQQRWISPNAQCLKKVKDDGSYLEIFKYFTKLIAKDGEKREYFDAVHMNVIFEAMKGKRVYFRIGSKKAWQCDEVKEADDADLKTQDEEDKIWNWMDNTDYFGYYDIDSGETLTEMRPPKNMNTILENTKEHFE